MLNFFAVGLDGLAAQVKLLGNLTRTVRSTQKLKDLHLAIGQALDADTRAVRFFAQRSLHYRRCDSVAEIQFSRENFAHCPEHCIGGVLLHDVTGSAGTQRALSENQLIILRKDEHLYFGMLDPQCFDEVERVAALQPQIENHQIGFALLYEPLGVRDVVRDSDTGEVRLTIDQLFEPITKHRVILDHDGARLLMAFSLRRHGRPKTAGCTSNGTRQWTMLPRPGPA